MIDHGALFTTTPLAPAVVSWLKVSSPRIAGNHDKDECSPKCWANTAVRTSKHGVGGQSGAAGIDSQSVRLVGGQA